MVELGFRARRILYAAVTEYIASGEPVSSRTLSKRYGLDLSSASIRNVLADLEDEGLLAQPHTSAGRIPTDKGFRAFVDALLQMRDIATEDRSLIVERMRSLRPGVDNVLQETGRLLASLTGAAAVVMPTRPEGEILVQMRFMPLREGELLAVLVTRSGKIENRIVGSTRTTSPEELDRIHNYLSELIRDGRTLSEARDALAHAMESELNQYAAVQTHVKDLLDAAIDARVPASNPAMLIEGQRLLFGRPEFADVDKMRALVGAFEDKERLLELLDRTLISGGVRVAIGAEANLGIIQDVSVISAPYMQGGTATGTLGIIGPTRMDYAKVVPMVSFTAQMMGNLLDGKKSDGDK